MTCITKYFIKVLFLSIFFCGHITTFSQEIDIKDALINIEKGEIDKAVEFLKKNYTESDPSILFLDAVLTSDGKSALNKYINIFEKFPESRYADAALYRIYTYYYSIGAYKKAESYLNTLKKNYPSSPYLKYTDRNLPDTTDEVEELKEYKYTVQAGAFLKKENAERLVSQLKMEGYECEIISREIGGSLFSIVLAGKFENEIESKPLLELLENKFSIKGRLVDLDQYR
ncbi:SPOR domain-containing protein [Melioribacter sp. OK-6-Me]|uniref:SPOR domain-containing protein n=1 Tax=unclassified Melioribacter TaxID=2627329 RepID=UPI003EDB1884